MCTSNCRGSTSRSYTRPFKVILTGNFTDPPLLLGFGGADHVVIVLDGAGAETLLGNGDMLFIPPAKSEPSRMQGAYIASEETERLIKWFDDRREAKRAAFAAQGLVLEESPDAEDDIIAKVREREALEAATAEGGEGGDNADDRDKLFREAAEVVVGAQSLVTKVGSRSPFGIASPGNRWNPPGEGNQWDDQAVPYWSELSEFAAREHPKLLLFQPRRSLLVMVNAHIV